MRNTEVYIKGQPRAQNELLVKEQLLGHAQLVR